ncbi:hypothetical protein [Okeania sp.]|uniref:hypothetical protein n=1 Tax=Okeania sp. TaxID=3100323 RepID=UPI002B4B91FD|nr:hypothetical protein [Okeania sp.]MEB3342857.1 hypothetical protein [Okeania sp.]
MVEDIVKMVVVSPLLDLAGFDLPPFYTNAESSIEIEDRDKELIIRGIIYVLVLSR